MRQTRHVSCLSTVRSQVFALRLSLCEYACFETVLACITTLLTNCGPFKYVLGNRDHGVTDCSVSKSLRLTVKLPHLCLHTVTNDICSC